MEKINQFNPEKKLEKGANVTIDLKLIRHGDRVGPFLTDYGRMETLQRAEESGVGPDDYNIVKGMGSNVNPNPKIKDRRSMEMGRALETADIYVEKIIGDKRRPYRTMPQKKLSYENIISPPPFDWNKVYDSFLPENFKDLLPEEKAKASKIAQTKTVNYLISLKTPEAETFKKELAGSYACLIDFLQRETQRVKSGTKMLRPAGTHGGMMEFILQYALVRKDKKGNKIIGFNDVNEIGGELNPSEAFNVRIATDQEAKILSPKLTFDNPARPDLGEMYLDQDKINELKYFYLSLHKE